MIFFFYIWLVGTIFNTILYFADLLIYWSELKSFKKVREAWHFEFGVLLMGILLSWLLIPVLFIYQVFNK